MGAALRGRSRGLPSRLTDEAQACSRKTAVTECLLILQDGPGLTRRDPVKFGLFYQLPCADPQSEVTRYQETIEQIIHADALGFDCAWLAELHFFKPFSIMPSPLIVATAAAQRTKKIRLGIAANSPDTAVFAGKTRSPVFVASVTNPLPRMFEQVATYRQAWAEGSALSGSQASAGPDVSTMFFFYPGESVAQVRRDIEPSLNNYFHSVSQMVRAGAKPQGEDESYRYLQDVQRHIENLTFDKITQTMAIFGSSQECIAKVKELHTELQMNELICWFNPGGLVPHEKVLAAMSRFAAEALPELRPL